MPGYLTLPGTSGNYVSTADVNLLDADTAHLYQSRGLMVDAGNVTAASASADDTGDGVAFAGKSLEVTASVASATSMYIRTLSGGTSNPPGAGGTAYSADGWIYVSQEILDLGPVTLSCVLFWVDSGGSYLGEAAGDGVVPTEVGWYRVEALNKSSHASTAHVAIGFKCVVTTGVATGETWKVGQSQLVQAADVPSTFVPSLRIVGDIDIEAKAAATDWTSASQYLIAFGDQSTYGYTLVFDATPRMYFFWDGNNENTTAWSFTDGVPAVVRVTRDAGTGAVVWYQDGSQIDTDTSTPSAISLPTSTITMNVGTNNADTIQFTGDFFYAEVRDGIDGVVVARFDAEQLASHASMQAGDSDTYTGDDDDRTWTLNGSGSTVYWPDFIQQGSDAVMSHLSNLDNPPVSLGIVGALNEKSGGTELGYRAALLNYFNVPS